MGFDNKAQVAEEHDYPELPITSLMPPALLHTLYRNGSNPVRPDPKSQWFIIDGTVHAFSSGPLGVGYKNRWVRTRSWVDGRGQSIAKSPAGVANTNVLSHAGHLLALEEANLPVAINPASLATIGAEDFAGTLPDAPFTGHPTHDPRTGALVFFGYGANDFSDTIRIGELSRSGGLIRLEQAFAPYAAMVHDFAVTDRFVAIPLFPLIEWTWQPKRGA